MLGWRQLTLYQRIYAVFILTVFVLGGVPAIVLTASVAGRLTILGGICCGLAFILSPKAYSQPLQALASEAEVPGICRVMLLGGVVLVGIGAVMSRIT